MLSEIEAGLLSGVPRFTLGCVWPEQVSKQALMDIWLQFTLPCLPYHPEAAAFSFGLPHPAHLRPPLLAALGQLWHALQLLPRDVVSSITAPVSLVQHSGRVFSFPVYFSCLNPQLPLCLNAQ